MDGHASTTDEAVQTESAAGCSSRTHPHRIEGTHDSRRSKGGVFSSFPPRCGIVVFLLLVLGSSDWAGHHKTRQPPNQAIKQTQQNNKKKKKKFGTHPTHPTTPQPQRRGGPNKTPISPARAGRQVGTTAQSHPHQHPKTVTKPPTTSPQEVSLENTSIPSGSGLRGQGDICHGLRHHHHTNLVERKTERKKIASHVLRSPSQQPPPSPGSGPGPGPGRPQNLTPISHAHTDGPCHPLTDDPHRTEPPPIKVLFRCCWLSVVSRTRDFFGGREGGKAFHVLAGKVLAAGVGLEFMAGGEV